ncbi:SMC-Scp complex subunit ScpB [Roseivirga misakiensis]|uniref:SMC-Scp complex subunit ScpB n=1 Tax=Roseivirga misakiensis TaxID=1563681 RepID=A0A1E5T628_9BACT|nr:SMC-Scp complex subunit ScpB [Roseivirga misakiensis]OEK06844.1 SMC-Scp complex subunit ScpB [Roseivirga misakiensis]
MDFLSQHIEALIFCAQKPIKLADIQSCLTEMFETEVPEKDIVKSLEGIMEKYNNDTFPFEVTKIGGGYQFLTKPAYQASIGILLKQQSKKRLSTSALETLSIIAYKQPVTKSEIEQIRGVNCDYSVQKLLEKELIEIKGKSDAVGRPLLYGSSERFMDYFGINDLKDLPSPRDFAPQENVNEVVEKENPTSDTE